MCTDFENNCGKPELTAKEYLKSKLFDLDNYLDLTTKEHAETALSIQRQEAIQECIDKLEDYQNTEYYVNMLKGLLK